MFHFDSRHPTVTRGLRISRTPLHHTLPAFLNLNGRKTKTFLSEGRPQFFKNSNIFDRIEFQYDNLLFD